MKYLFITTLLSLSSLSFAADWKVIAHTTACDEKVQILGKEGEKFVKAVSGDKETKLFAKDGSTFSENSMQATEFVSQGGEVDYSFRQPSYVEANPPKLDVAFKGMKKRCKMDLTL